MPLKILTQKSFTGGHQHCPHFAVGNAQAQSNGVTLIQRQVQSPSQGSTVVSKAYRKPKIKASFVLGSPPKFYVTLRLDDYCISFTFDSSEFIKYSQGLKGKKILTQPIQYQPSVVIRNFKSGLDLYGRCVVIHGFIKINPEVLDLPPVVICSSQILRAAFALNKKFTLRTCVTKFLSFPLSFSFGYCQTS